MDGAEERSVKSYLAASGEQKEEKKKKSWMLPECMIVS